MLSASISFAADVDPLIQKNRDLAAYERQKPAWKIKEEEEAEAIKMKSFDTGTVGRKVFVFASELDYYISRAAMIAVLYQDAPCQLPIPQAKTLHAAESLYGRALVPACWGHLVTPTKDEVAIFTKFGDARKESLLNYVDGVIQSDGSAKYVKRAMSFEKFNKNVQEFHKEMR